MNTSNPDEHFVKLCNDIFDDLATPEEAQQLEQIALSSKNHLKYYTQRANEHASMMVLVDKAELQTETNNVLAAPKANISVDKFNYLKFSSTLALGLCVGLAIWWVNHSTFTFASITQIKNVKLVNTDFPINIYTRLGQGRLKIESGILTVMFDSQAEMVIEGPADIELVDTLNCIVHEGRVITSMPKGESGFNVRTSFSNFLDLGTKFGVCVSKHGVAVLEVFDGEVDANHLASGKTTRIAQGERFISSINKFSKELEKEDVQESIINPTIKNNTHQIIGISTNNGEGADATVVRDQQVLVRKNNIFNYPDFFIMLKNCVDDQGGWDRKAYLKFDMNYVKQHKVVSAKLKLNLVNSQIGYSSRCPDSTFAIYGILEPFEIWPEEFTWNNSPAASELANSVNLSQAVLLGRFTIAQGITEGFFTVKSNELTQLINDDKNQSIILVIVRETQESETGGIVHCFAGGQSVDGVPPTLLLEIENSK